MWRISFLLDEAGYWDPCPGLAVALQAARGVRGEDVAKRPLHPLLPRWIAREQYIGPAPDADPAGQAAAAAERKGGRAGGSGGKAAAKEEELRPMPQRGWVAQWQRERAAARAALATACPLSGPSVDAIAESIPALLLGLAARSRGAVNAPRVWTTLLCCSFLTSRHEHLLAQEPDHVTESGTTLMDSANAWLAKQCAASAELEDAMEELRALAKDQQRAWDVRHDMLLGLLQGEEQKRSHGARLGRGRHAQFAATRVVRALQQGHETLSLFLGPADEPLPRQWRAVQLITMILAILCVSVWFHYSRSVNCCLRARELLGCSQILGETCRGFTGTCGAHSFLGRLRCKRQLATFSSVRW